MQYFNVEWTRMIKQLISQKGIDQSTLARRMGTSTASLTQVLRRGKLTLTTVRRISVALDEDLVVHLLSQESMLLWKKAIKAGLKDIPIEEIDPELIKEKAAMIQDKESTRTSTLAIQEKIDQQALQIQALKEKMDQERRQYELQIARLEAKIEAYQEMRSSGFPPTNLA